MPRSQRRSSSEPAQHPQQDGVETASGGRSMAAMRRQLSRHGSSGSGTDQRVGDLSLWGTAAAEGGQGDADGSTARGFQTLSQLCRDVGQDAATSARERAARFAAERRSRLGIDGDELTELAGRVWTAADQMVRAVTSLERRDAEGAQDAAHGAAEILRGLRDAGQISAEAVEAAVARAGQIWTRADALGEQEQAEASSDQMQEEYAVWTTGRPGGRGEVTSRELDGGGNWSRDSWLSHHSDRSDSWAARNIRDAKNQELQAYDFTFERKNGQGQAMAGTAQGLELISPWDARVHDVNQSLAQSGGYGKFIALEDLETGLRFEVHHMDSVADVRKGETVSAGQVIGTQGASGRGRYSFATHVDIVGTAEAVEQFVRANQSGRVRSRKRPDGA